MENICAIIDAQGFMYKGEWVIRELAGQRIGDNFIRSWDVKTPIIEESMTFSDKITNEYIKNNHNGLAYNPPDYETPLEYTKIKAFLTFLHRHWQKGEDVNFGIKNPQLGKILKQLKIPFIELEAPSYQTLMNVYKTTVFCGNRHIFKPDGVCAVQKVDHMYNWLKDRKAFESLVNSG